MLSLQRARVRSLVGELRFHKLHGAAKKRKKEKKILKQSKLKRKGAKKEEQTKPKVSRRKKIIKIRVEINEID